MDRVSSLITCAAAGCLALGAPDAPAWAQTSVTGKVTVIDKGDRPANDVGQAVVWLEPARPVPVAPGTSQVVISDKEFKPRVVVVTAGSTVSFPNADPFDHNVFSLSQEGVFDLGLYGRGTTKSTQLKRPGIIRVYCNVHAQMSAFVVVRDAPYYAQPGADGAFSIGPLPPGAYTLHAWHERAAELQPQTLQVNGAGVNGLDLQLDARGYKFVQHLNKYGQPYPTKGRRY